MGIACKTATDCRFRDDGMCAPDSSHDCGVVSLTCTMTEETWECSTSSSKANTLAKPTAHNSWEAASVSGKPKPCANTTRSKRKSLVNKDCPFVLVFRTKREQHAVAEVPRFEQVNRPVNGIASAQIFIQPRSSND